MLVNTYGVCCYPLSAAHSSFNNHPQYQCRLTSMPVMRRSLELLGHERSSEWMCRSCCGSRYMLTLKLQISHNIDYLEFVDNVKTTLRWYRSGVSRVQPVTKAGFACRDGNGKPTRRSCLELGGRLQQQLELPESQPSSSSTSSCKQPQLSNLILRFSTNPKRRHLPSTIQPFYLRIIHTSTAVMEFGNSGSLSEGRRSPPNP